MDAVYFDHNATTPVDPRVVEAMLPWLTTRHGNPSSAHGAGRAAARAVDEAREQVAALLGGQPQEVVFTASGTEANNAVVFDRAARAAKLGHPGHLVISSFEHPSVVAAAARLEAGGTAVTRVPPGPDGVVPAAAVIEALRPETFLVCLMLANNEVGTVQPVAEVAAACRQRGIPVLCDAVQAVGKMAVDAPALGVDYLTLGAHKFHGPLGAAALWIRDGLEFTPYLLGGGQEGGRRAGTVNVPAVVGLGAACALAAAELPRRAAFLQGLRDRFEAGLEAGVPEISFHGREAPTGRLPHTTHVAFDGLLGLDLMHRLDELGFAVSIGAACGSGKPTPSPALLAMGLPRERALACLRVSFGMTNTAEEVDRLLAVLPGEVTALREQEQDR